MIVLGIDPGYARVGYGVISFENSIYKTLDYNSIITGSKQKFSERLEIIFDEISRICEKYKPDEVAIESLYFQKNRKTVIGVAEARGVILLSLQKKNLNIFEYTPLQIKSVITGYGKAQKYQIISMVVRLLRLENAPNFDDTADALAIALCHVNFQKIQKNLTRG
ncbi:MAG: crossover junction endodeoxyribonuclease RuvC [Candidatus Paraimprobicoccus trichonymphae]|uniref:Crossover junction endodeoxyribonuclease RuvC n=1 Tax=Candidatus Paraimprobicoccus trichonymphae TaxID=3033793 RepID=A0AA48IHG3_9FIRM|nr:MAG: crossover junction endodeoxyribonuclease RuvC [Candidatus Paraimprobicoccus trichonymphae]